jgi:hypothetical protein
LTLLQWEKTICGTPKPGVPLATKPHCFYVHIIHCVAIDPYSADLVVEEIFIQYAVEAFPFLIGRKGTFDPYGTYLSLV